MNVLTQAFTLARGRGRVTFEIDLAKWTPGRRAVLNPPDTWTVRYDAGAPHVPCAPLPAGADGDLRAAWARLLGCIATEIPNHLKSIRFYEAVNDVAFGVANIEAKPAVSPACGECGGSGFVGGYDSGEACPGCPSEIDRYARWTDEHGVRRARFDGEEFVAAELGDIAMLSATRKLRATAWPIPMVVWRMANAVDHLLHDHACDAHGWEGVTYALDAARKWLDLLPAGTVPQGEDGKAHRSRAGTECEAGAERVTTRGPDALDALVSLVAELQRAREASA